MSNPKITVSGNATHYHAPERAVLRLRVNFSSLEKSSAYNATVTLHNALVNRAKELREAEAATWYSAQAPTSYAQSESWIPEGAEEPLHRLRYSSASSLEVRFSDFLALGEWIAELSSAANSGVRSSVSWELTDKTKVALQKQVRIEAVRNAKSLASDYAEGAELSGELKLLELSDTPYASGGNLLRGAAAGSTRGAAAPVAEMSPNDIQISASVTATFQAV